MKEEMQEARSKSPAGGRRMKKIDGFDEEEEGKEEDEKGEEGSMEEKERRVGKGLGGEVIGVHRQFRLFLISNVDRGEKHQHRSTGEAGFAGRNNSEDGEKDIADGSYVVWGERHSSEADDVEQGMILSGLIGDLRTFMEKDERASRSMELGYCGDIDEDGRLLFKYLADAHDAAERRCDMLSESVRGVDSRADCLPMIMMLVQKFMAPLMREIDVDYEKLAGLGELLGEIDKGGQTHNYMNSDKIQFIKYVCEGTIKVDDSQLELIRQFQDTSKFLCEWVYSDMLVGGEQGEEREW